MAEKEIFCCTGQIPCSSYKNDGLMSFKYVKFSKKERFENYGTEGIRWIFMLTGVLEVENQGQVNTVQGGEMCLLFEPNYAIQGLSDVEFIYFVSDRPTEYCVQMLRELPENPNLGITGLSKLKIEGILNEFLHSLLIYLKDGLDCRYLFEEKQQELFMILSVCYSKEELASYLYSLTLHQDKDLRKFILDNCLKVKNVQELATMCGYSLGGFKRIFKEMFKEPIYQWILKQKAERLQMRLLEKNVNLKVLIDEFGFSSPAHFTKFCKQWLGMVPTQFIKSQHEKFEL